MNISWSRALIENLVRAGVRDVIVCAGARNSPLVMVLAETSGVEIHSFFEERSAAFFALGIARRDSRPVAVVTTSGTATAQLLPALIEAFHTGVPLIAVTADRPKRLRGTGAPQAIDQTGLYAKFVEREFDLENGELASFDGWSRRAPLHLNVCFDEPLIDEKIEKLDLAALASAPLHAHETGAGAAASADGSLLNLAGDTNGRVALTLGAFVARAERLLVVVGTISSREERAAIENFLARVKAPIYAEGTSGLRESTELEPWLLRAGDRGLSRAIAGPREDKAFTHVLRLGGVPTVRIWRDLDDEKSQVEVFSLSSLPFAGLSRGDFAHVVDVASVVSRVDFGAASALKSFMDDAKVAAYVERDRLVARELEALYEREPQAEPSLVRAVSRAIPTGSELVYIGNSLPIREWDFAADITRPRAIEANRGVNGIDGQLSTFLGLARDGQNNWAILGDLTTLYDLSGPWALRTRNDVGFRLVVINNGGGKIFERIFGRALFENGHHLGFEAWARMWQLDYEKWSGGAWPSLPNFRQIIEVIPSNEATRRFWDHYDKLWS